MNRTWIAATLALGFVATAHAERDAAHPLGQHPALLVQQQHQGIDANTFIVGHPASPTWTRSHANHEHPAVVAARAAKHTPVDPNTYLVQPPATTTWTLAPAVELPARVALAQ